MSHSSEQMGIRTAFGFLVSTFMVAIGLFLVYVAGNIIFSSSEGAIFQWWIAIPGIGLAVVGSVLLLWTFWSHSRETKEGV